MDRPVLNPGCGCFYKDCKHPFVSDLPNPPVPPPPVVTAAEARLTKQANIRAPRVIWKGTNEVYPQDPRVV